jgi:threonine/homoserine/homoserine lactone efflux protein
MPTVENLALFAAASVVLTITPGPNLLYLVSRTLCQGRAAGLVSLAGTTCGFTFHVLAASFGLSAVFIAVPLAYDVVRWAGAAYLVWLAWDAIRSGADGGLFKPRALAAEPASKLFRNGFLTSVLNPKLALFYLALFPQFVDPAHASVLTQSLALGAVQILISCIGDGVFVLTSAALSGWLSRRPTWMAAQRWLLATVFVGIAAKLALDERR